MRHFAWNAMVQGENSYGMWVRVFGGVFESVLYL